MDVVTSLPSLVIHRTVDQHSVLDELPRWALYILALGCLSLAAIVAGLTLGLMSLDMIGLEILQNSVVEKDRESATKVAEIRKDGNLLLVTLLLTNTLAMEFLPLVMDTIFPGGLFSLILSVLLVMLFGEVIPQAVCSRHALEIGSRFVWLVKILRFLLYPVAKPISWCLDNVLGVEMGQIYTREELKGLVDIHNRNKYGVLTSDETSILKGALDLESKKVEQIMTKADDVFMLNVDDTLNRDTMKKILHYGHSRVPLYLNHKANVVGMLLIKQLVLIDPDDEIPIRAMFNKKKKTHKIRVAPPVYASRDVNLHEMLNEFQYGRSHLAIIYDNIDLPPEKRKFLGLITLEDIIEELLQEEIVDETDVYIDNTRRKRVLNRNVEGRLVRAGPPGEIVSARRLPGTTHILVREIDLKEIKKPIRDELNFTYGTFSGLKRQAQGVVKPEVPTLFEPGESGSVSKSPLLPSLADVVVDRAPAQSGVIREDDSMRSGNMFESGDSDADRVRATASTHLQVDVASDDESRPGSAPPRVEYDDDEWHEDQPQDELQPSETEVLSPASKPQQPSQAPALSASIDQEPGPDRELDKDVP